MIDKIVEKFRNLEECEAILLGGSRATGVFDESSDYDLYVYTTEPLSEDIRKKILKDHVKYMEYSNRFWELEDDGTLNNGVDIELIYRSVKDLKEMLDNGISKGNVSHGYTTCFVDNLLHSKILFDKNGSVKQLRDSYQNVMTDKLIQNIVDYNYPILLDKMPSLYYQIEKAMKRGDTFSINHRSTAFFEMYFDILYAINKTTHPGEKRLMEMASKLDKVPVDMNKDFEQYFSNFMTNHGEALNVLENMVLNLKDLLEKLEYSELTHRSYK